MPSLSPIGGQLISSFGGVLGFLPFQGILPAPGSPPPTAGQTILDCARWTKRRRFTIDDTTHTGSWGQDGADIVSQGFTLSADVVWNIYNPPNFLALNGGQVSQADFDNGFQLWAYVGSGLNYPASQGSSYYYCPSAKGNIIDTIIDAVAKKEVRAHLEIVSNGPCFAFGGTVTDQALYNLYVAHCLNRGWVW